MKNKKNVEREIEKIYKAVYKKIFNKKNLKLAAEGKDKSISTYVINLESSKQYERFCKKFSESLAKKGLNNEKGLWKKYYEAARSKHLVGIPSSYKKFELEIFKKTVNKNFKMIKSIPQKVLNVYKQKYIESLIEQVASGSKGRKYFENQLKEHGYKNAKLIARTETAKLRTSIQEISSKNLGSVAYIWESTRDQRTRQSHKDMNNVVVFWRNDNEKPLLDGMRGNAGEFPNCRCDTISIFDTDDINKLGNKIKVYDYRKDKVVSYSKTFLIECLERGEL